MNILPRTAVVTFVLGFPVVLGVHKTPLFKPSTPA